MYYYVHIPFCHRVCPYCKFAVSPVVNELTRKRYLEYLKKEIVDFFRDENSKMGVRGEVTVGTVMKINESKNEASTEGVGLPLETFGTFGHKSTENGVGKDKYTLYFGGGTPSILSIEELKEILECFGTPSPSGDNGRTERLHDYSEVGVKQGWGEVTLESNPEDITEEKVKGWKSLGVNRTSLGVQSLDDKVLNTIKRANRETILKALEILNQHFNNINVDLILGLPYSKSGGTLEDIKRLHDKFQNITHTSIYILEDERYPEEWKGHYPTTEEVQTEYIQICDYLESKGWHHYELSNWAKPGYESIHNQSYWNHSEYRGFGLSAGSYMQGKRFANASNFRDYFAGKREEEILTEEQIRIEKIMFGLRTFSLDESLITNKEKLGQFLKEGLLCREDGISQKQEVPRLSAKDNFADKIECKARGREDFSKGVYMDVNEQGKSDTDEEVRRFSGIQKIFPTKTGIFMLDYIISELISD